MQQRENVLVIKKCQPVKDSSFVFFVRLKPYDSMTDFSKNILLGLKNLSRAKAASNPEESLVSCNFNFVKKVN